MSEVNDRCAHCNDPLGDMAASVLLDDRVFFYCSGECFRAHPAGATFMETEMDDNPEIHIHPQMMNGKKVVE